jgi:uncharacterized protein
MTRRDFLKAALAAGGGAAALTGCASAPAPAAPRAKPDEVPCRILGRTADRVTIIGLGCAYAALRGSDSVTWEVVEAALDGGIRYFDTSSDYTDSETMLGPVLRPVRDEVFIATKINAFDAAKAEAELAASLARLGTDHVDLLMQHGVGCQAREEHLPAILGRGGSLEFMCKAKERGLARFIGMSVHAPHGPALALLRASDAWDVVMPFINYVSRARGKAETELLPLAAKRQLGVVAMKVFGGRPGAMAADYDRAFRYALSVPGVACALIGTKNADEVACAIRAAKAFRPFTDTEMEETIRRGAALAARPDSVEARLLCLHAPRDWGSGAFANG